MRGFILFTILCFTSLTTAQHTTISSQLLDSVSGKPIPYATIVTTQGLGVISNGEGLFSIGFRGVVSETDSIKISCMGYGSRSWAIKGFDQEVIKMSESSIELQQVIVSNKNYTAGEIVQLVKDNLSKNYLNGNSKMRLFYRHSDLGRLEKLDYKLKKSTIKELNKPFIDSLFNSIPETDDYYTEVLGDLYWNPKGNNSKIALIKASELYDKNRDLGLEALEDKLDVIVKQNIKPDSYFKIKSGILSFRVQGDGIFEEEGSEEATMIQKELEEQKKEEQEEREDFANYRRKNLNSVLEKLFFTEDPKLNFIQKVNRYDFELTDFTFLGEDPIYVLNFKPKRSEKYKGTIYVNADDFAIVRVDYQNVKRIKNFNLFGISYRRYLDKGLMFFNKSGQDGYKLSYYEEETASRAGVKRPLKVIEKNKHVKGRRKQNELSMDLDLAFQEREKMEVVVFEHESISEASYNDLKEKNEVEPTYMPQYNPEFWQGYQIMEPNTAIKEFRALEAK